MKQNYNESYRIALYQLPQSYFDKLHQYLNNPNYYANSTFEVACLNQLKITNQDLILQPDVLLIDNDAKITNEISEYCARNFVQIIRVTDKPIQLVTNEDDIVVSFSSDIMIKHSLTNSNTKMITQLENSIDIIKDLAEISNISKLRYVSTKILQDESEKVMPSNDREAVLETLIKLNYFMELKDDYTKMHSNHVSDYAVLLGKELRLSDDDLELLRIGGELHDIGKVGIPDAILRKNDSLTDQEFDIMKRHTIIGDVILPSEGYQDIKQMIRSHHEKMDGTGYPDGLKGKDIPYFARILSVVDTFDAMTTQRTYNKKKTLEEAFEELRRASRLEQDRYGKLTQQLDPELVEYFIKAVKKNQDLMEEFRQRDIEIMKFRKQQELEENIHNMAERGL